MSQPLTVSRGFTPPEKRITKEINAKLEELAPLFMIQVKHLPKNRVELSGTGFSHGAPLILDASVAKVRLLAEICGILARWITFNMWEPCEVTLFALPATRIDRCSFNWRKQLNQQAKLARVPHTPPATPAPSTAV